MDLPELYPGFSSRTIDTGEARIFVRVGGREDRPAVVLVHGYPQTGAMWHAIAPALAEHYHVVIPDLRGYGRSDVPALGPGHAQMSKRAMARDIVRVMDALGHARFAYVGHDRGARAGYRLALDHPERIARLALLDIVPTLAMWDGMGAKLALKAYHWPFLAQPAPMPERLIGADPVFYLEHTLRSWTAAKSLDAFSADALAHYRAFYSEPERIAATCEDYRAGAFLDPVHDAEDRAAGRLIEAETLVMWGASGFPSDAARNGDDDGTLGVWRRWCLHVTGRAIDCGHFLAEEAPEAVIAALLPFLAAGADDTLDAAGAAA